MIKTFLSALSLIAISLLFFACPPARIPVDTPVFSLQGGTYTGHQDVSITITTAGASIHYTTDGSIPDTSSAEYTAPILVDTDMTIKAVGISADYADSDIATTSYIINPPYPAGFNTTQGRYADQIELNWNTVGDAVKYYLYKADSATGPYTYFYEIANNFLFISVPVETHVYHKISSVDASNNEGAISSSVHGWTTGTVPQTIIWEKDTINWEQYYTNDTANNNKGKITLYTDSSLTPGNIVQTDVKKHSGYLLSGFGIIFGYNDIDNYWLFNINLNGSYRIDQTSGGIRTTIVDWTAGASINTDYSNVNNLKVEATLSNYLDFYINGTLGIFT